jgi:Ser/Thr protein kinase RdoA (MazF antagonist)
VTALPFVTRPPADLAVAAGLAARAAARWGLPDPVLLRVGMTAIYVAGDDTVLRVHRPNGDPTSSTRLARFLAEAGVLVPRPRHDEVLVDTDTDGAVLAVAAFERIGDHGPIDWRRVGEQVRLVHTLSIDEVAERQAMPWCGDVPWWDVRSLLDEVGSLVDAPALAGMEACWAEHGGWAAMVSDDERVVCHGDVHPGNVIAGPDGPVLLDWDLLCVGLRSWDHAALATWTDRWGGEPGIAEAFRDGAGESYVDDTVGQALAALRLLVATLMRVRAGQSNPAVMVEAERRLRWWRGDRDAPMWNAM